MNNIGGSA